MLRTFYRGKPDFQWMPRGEFERSGPDEAVVRKNRPAMVLGEMALVLAVVCGIAFGVTSLLPALGVPTMVAQHMTPPAHG